MADPNSAEALEKQLVWQYFGCPAHGTFVEVGANDPFELSQTWLLESKGWSGVLIEPLAECAERLRQMRPRSRVLQAAAGAPGQEGESLIHIPGGTGHAFIQGQVDTDWSRVHRTEKVRIQTMNHLLEEAGITAIDFLSMDVEGMELDVLRGLDLQRYHPGLILVEDHLRTLQVHFYLRDHGYRLVKRTGLNNWYVPANTPFTMVTWQEKANLIRKIWLKHPFRLLHQAWCRFRAPSSRATRT
jgi:FkbM family methyltransferase